LAGGGRETWWQTFLRRLIIAGKVKKLMGGGRVRWVACG
jgi:hypothetical protein